jgi:tRNA 2-thiocytidine biosynthesis protein TtcA
MLSDWEQQDPGRSGRLLRSLRNVTPSHLADATLVNFAELESSRDQRDS